MPITVAPSNKPLEPYRQNSQTRRLPEEKGQVIARSSIPKEYSNFKRIPSANGFVSAVCEAYNNHHHLILDPKHVWFSILTQFSNYMVMHSEKLRPMFVAHEDKKELVVESFGTLQTANYEELTLRMGQVIQENLKERGIAEWAAPAHYSVSDRVIGTAILMASMKNFFKYKFNLKCGFPKVTLLGKPEDWQDLETRAQVLGKYESGDGLMTKWLKLLLPVLKHFKESAQGSPNLEWWNRACSNHNGGSGPTYLSGWITAFCVFDNEGKWIGDQLQKHMGYMQFTFKDSHPDFAPEGWPLVDTQSIPSGVSTVDVVVDDRGTKYNCALLAGNQAMLVEGDAITPYAEWVLKCK